MSTLKDKVIFISGASRGIGEAIALRAAEDGACIVIAAKTTTPHPTLPGTIFTVAKEIEKRGGKALPLEVDIRFEDQIHTAMDRTIAEFGQLDILVNNASAISLTPTLQTPMKKFDLMFGVNVRGTFACSQAAIPHLSKSDNPHILNLSPPLSMKSKWFQNHVAYTMSKYGMSMCTLGMAEEFRAQGIAVNSLWPKRAIATMAIKVLAERLYNISRNPSIMADAAYHILIQNSRSFTGNFVTDEEVLIQAGINDFSQYETNPNHEAPLDFFLDDPND